MSEILSIVPRIDTARNAITSYDIPLHENEYADLISVNRITYIVVSNEQLAYDIRQLLGSNEVINLAGRSRQYGGMLGFAIPAPKIPFTKQGGKRLGVLLQKGLEIKSRAQEMTNIQ